MEKSNGSTQNSISTGPLRASQKVYVHSHHRPDVAVGMRTIVLSNTEAAESNGHGNQPFVVYDTSGPYTDSTVETDIRKGLEPLRLNWIEARADIEEISGSYTNGNGQDGSKKEALTERFPAASKRPVLRAKAGRNVSQMHYARQGVVTPEMEYIAIRE